MMGRVTLPGAGLSAALPGIVLECGSSDIRCLTRVRASRGSCIFASL